MPSSRGTCGNLSRGDPLRALLESFRSQRDIEASLRRAEAAEAMLLEAMIELKQRFERSFPAAQPARLVLHRTGRSAALRWRLPDARKRRHDFFKLDMSSETGREVLKVLPPSRRARFLAYQSRALALNAAYAVHRGQRDVLASYLEKSQSLERTLDYFNGPLE